MAQNVTTRIGEIEDRISKLERELTALRTEHGPLAAPVERTKLLSL